ncbi:hypothetical protein [Chryseobacterium polytrichastri]|uniref:Uncharacterized protein n=1 Tax=Chryseobacterium polytrichastri TaxID=1302687 RepID=A0A1M7BLP1_9FLAO|nr:hypothetical protein [Chryseobacterium polytrichastri]SHL55833.1 hypothetical protein SAMN05444267_10207 [Chryseobacterium polytrichastri]
MIKNTFKLILLTFFLLGVLAYSQEKKKFSSIPNILRGIVPNNKTDFWVLVYNTYAKDQEVKVSGTKKEYIPQSSGFNLFPNEDSFYYIAYSSGGKMNYVTDLDGLKTFIGKVDNIEEAAIAATVDGYLVDEEFKDVAGNYYEDASNYYLDLGKLTSKECPYQKKHYTVTINKSTGAITNVKDNGSYIELYNKKCANNPRLLKIEKKEEPKDEPKKSTRSTQRK